MNLKEENYFHIIAENSGDVIWILNLASMRFTYISPSVRDLRGFTPEEVMEQRLEDMMTANSYQFVVENIPRRVARFQSGDKNLRILTGEIDQIRKDGSIVPTEVVTTLITDAEGNVTEILGISRDSTRRKRIESQLIESKERAQESDRLKTMFLQNMSHEIRTPMNAIIGFSELLTDVFDDKEKLQFFARIIRHRSADLLRLIDDILALSRIEAGEMPIYKERFNLPALTDELYHFFLAHREQIERSQIEILLSQVEDPRFKMILTDKMKLKQIFINLIYNALKFTTRGHVRFGTLLDEQEKLVFFVSDTGRGIPPEKQGTVFERFRQLDNSYSGKQEGSGLGLSIVKGLIDCMGGTIRLESELGKGSTFYFTLPYELSEQIPRVEKKPISDEPLSWENYSVLIVEDETFNAEFLKIILAPTKIQVQAVPDALKAIDLIHDGVYFDLILMDIRMPGLDGYEATRIIKNIVPSIKVIAQTAFASPSDRKKAFDSGCDDFISKPIDKYRLFSKMRDMLEGEGPEREMI